MNNHSPLVPKPFLFNPLKHHAGFLRTFAGDWGTGRINDWDASLSLLRIGKCMLDLYYGALSIPEIVCEMRAILQSKQLIERRAYLDFISGSKRRYQIIEVSDGSRWTLLQGKDPLRYIHIHPARSSCYTIRVGALALKTAIILKAKHDKSTYPSDLVTAVNRVRDEFLRESPVKNSTYTLGVTKVLEHI